MVRATMSAPPPACDGTITRTGFVGYDCANATGAASANAQAAAKILAIFLSRKLFVWSMVFYRGPPIHILLFPTAPIFRTPGPHINTNKNNGLQNITRRGAFFSTLKLSHQRSGVLQHFGPA
jgi:hypothetical protein